MARLAFRNLLKDPLFIVREETDNDYGVVALAPSVSTSPLLGVVSRRNAKANR